MPSGPVSFALVDFRSLVSGPVSEASCRDAVELASELARVAIVPRNPTPPPHDLRLRVYGGFRDRGGNPTPEYVWLLKHIGLLRGLSLNVRTTPEIALNVLHLPNDDLIATYRKQEQKMVDTTLAADAIEVAAQSFASVTIVSNDDDFVPVLASISRAQGRTQWLRKPRTSPNDAMLQRNGVILLSDPAWT